MAGIGVGAGTGAACAYATSAHPLTRCWPNQFSEAGPVTASRSTHAAATSLVDDIHLAGGEVKAFSVTSYERSTLHATFAQIRAEYPGAPLFASRSTTPPRRSGNRLRRRGRGSANVIGQFDFAREAILELHDPDPQNIHVLTVTIDDHILTRRSKTRLGDKCDGWSTDEDRPESIAREGLP
ncbi:hypothetical protein EXIGLDRAFT_778718 [Exidia glandulosa HHB12029]|uniref:Uncharacterized protein n=1 Tax=Exidia glandulosa HHB12029 TaxID=1314781 RepID=A0A165CEC8_EXIGL|nr:hypothetical protein EXIGLDRAFT_778718 [Exidia glandulosa HHB12029]